MFRTLGPYLFEGVRTSCIMAVGDVLAQTVVDKRNVGELDWDRTARYSSLGILVIGPALKGWFKFLDKMVTRKQPAMQRGFKMMLIDQVFFSPPLNAAVMTVHGLINGQNLETIKKRLMYELPDIMKYNYMIWPAAQTINFSMIPLNYQVVYVCVVVLFWNIVLSKMLNAGLKKPKETKNEKMELDIKEL